MHISASLSRSMTPKLPLGDGDYLRPLVEADVSASYVDGLNNPLVNRFLVGPRQQRQTEDLVRAFVRANFEASDAILFGAFIGGDLRGTTRLHDISDGTAYLGIALFDPAIWGKGWARRIVRAVTQFAAEDLGLKEIRAGIEASNVGSQKAFAMAGFKRKSAVGGCGTESATLWVWHPAAA